jgi:hypothetical protein
MGREMVQVNADSLTPPQVNADSLTPPGSATGPLIVVQGRHAVIHSARQQCAEITDVAGDQQRIYLPLAVRQQLIATGKAFRNFQGLRRQPCSGHHPQEPCLPAFISQWLLAAALALVLEAFGIGLGLSMSSNRANLARRFIPPDPAIRPLSAARCVHKLRPRRLCRWEAPRATRSRHLIPQD